MSDQAGRAAERDRRIANETDNGEDPLRRALEAEADSSEEEEAALVGRIADDPALAVALRDAEAHSPPLGALLAAPPPEGLVDRAMLRALERRAHEEAQPAWKRAADGRPLVVRLRPLALAVGLAAAAALALWLRTPAAQAPLGGVSPEAGTAARDDHAPEVAVRLVLPAAGARSVAVAGEFNGWSTDAHLLEDPEGDGVFVGLLRLPPGAYAYMFVVDGERWVTDPYAVTLRDDGFGQRNAVLRID